MDTSQTYANPDPPQTGGTEYFTLGGVFTIPAQVNILEFICHLGGIPVYDQRFTYPYGVEYPLSSWQYTLPFDVPSVAPDLDYFIDIKGHGTTKST